MSVHQQVLSVDNSIDRGVRWNHLVCPSTIPRGNVTCDGERETGTYVGISVTDRQTLEIEIRVSRLSEVTLPKEYRTAALGLWEGLSHSNSTSLNVCLSTLSVRRQFQMDM